MRLAVAGGTGAVGRLIVAEARRRGHEVLSLSRGEGVDLLTGTGLDLRGVDAVADVSSVSATAADAAIRFFRTVSRTLLDAEATAGVKHHLALSVVGVPEAPFGYYAGKAAQERVVRGGPVPWTILRATQFHEFAGQVLDAARIGGVSLVPKMRSQPLAASVVAGRVVDLLEAGPQGIAREIAGPREERMADLSRRWAAHHDERRRIVEVPLPGAWGAAIRDGRILPGPDADLLGPTFDDWLATSSAA
ncbi:SDR family oxidoreductase [Microbacterium sp. ZW T5_56]|uniref:SDR family oxidoreductase n=1 Tax=Microbacterium sp. ZW T5_56 TaxID=3378081 RepID=UPI003852FA7D